MTNHPFDAIPELAGLATYRDAARIGYSVDENVRRLLRYQWIERRLMGMLVAHLPAEPVWEVKCAFALQQWQAAERVDAIRSRVAEMRNPLPSLDAAPDVAIDTFLDELLHSGDTAERLAGVHGVLLQALAQAYRAHIAASNPLVDQPTLRLLRIALMDVDDAVTWGTRALEVIVAGNAEAKERADRWRQRLEDYLSAAGGIAGDGPRRTLDRDRSALAFVPEFHPRRDERFQHSYNFDFPPHDVYAMPHVPADERNLALLCKRALEMDVPEMMASFMTERIGQPWEFYHQYSRQLWDEARHAMMGTVALEARGVDWKRELPLNVGFSLRLNLHAEPVERQVMLYAIEQSLMPRETGKRFEYETAVAAEDALSAHFHDYDWADEVLHAQIGRRMLRRDGISSEEAQRLAPSIHEKTWAALAAYRQHAAAWWPDFVERVLGHPSSAGVHL